MEPQLQQLEHRASFGGWQDVLRHRSEVLGCDMNVAVYAPPEAGDDACPVVYFLSGLACTEQNFITKAGVQRLAAELGLIIVAPDTSPRGDGIADADGYDLGKGAGFYLNATQAPWAANYRMHDYIVEELPALIEPIFNASGKRAIMGHSMGGHGALVAALRHPDKYRSVSAFAPICAPSHVPWGEKAFTAYLGDDRAAWRAWDATALIEDGKRFGGMLMVDQGLDDEFAMLQLRPELLETACKAKGQPLALRRHRGYDHSYYFIASFLADHLAHHARALRA